MSYCFYYYFTVRHHTIPRYISLYRAPLVGAGRERGRGRGSKVEDQPGYVVFIMRIDVWHTRAVINACRPHVLLYCTLAVGYAIIAQTTCCYGILSD